MGLRHLLIERRPPNCHLALAICHQDDALAWANQMNNGP